MKTYTYEETFEASIEFFSGDYLAAEVFAKKYALRDNEGRLLEATPEDMFRRLAGEFHRIESKYDNPISYEETLRMLASGEVWPQGSPMSAIGNPYQYQSLSNCFVIESPHDSYGGILKTDQEQAQVMKRRGGIGFDISSIRPRGLFTSNAARTTDGIGVFMERFSNTCREVAQGGRRGALMLTISVHHPEIRTFVNIKRDLKKVTGANISIRLTDEFMRAVEEGGKVKLRFPVDPDAEHIVRDEVDARELWGEIIESAWASAEPGLLFWDTVTRRTPADAYASLGYSSVSTNPCGEICLSPYDSCRLLLVNLTKFVVKPFTPGARFDYGRFEKIAGQAQKLMDDLVDLELEAVDKILQKIDADPEPESVKRLELELWRKIREAAVNGRRTGLGITGLGDTLAMLGMTYGSDESVSQTDLIYRSLALGAYRSSVMMAKERGAFPVFNHELEKGHEFIEQILNEDPKLRKAYERYGRRNIACTTTAPAGSVSILTQTTSGCEPAFLLSYKRRMKILNDSEDYDFVDDVGDKWVEREVIHHGFKQWMDVTGKSEVKDSPYWKSTSNDIDWVKKIDVQAAAQRWICHAISNTTNIPNETSIDVVKEIYMRGWKSGCKGVTIYRDGCRSGVLVSTESASSSAAEQPTDIIESHAPKRPKELPCDIHRASVGGVPYLVIVGLLNDRPYEIFCGLQEHVEVPRKIKKGILVKNGKVGGVATYNLSIPLGDDDQLVFKNIVELFDNPTYGALTRVLSLALRHGIPVQYVIEQLRKDKHSDITSFSSVIARVLSKHYVPDGTKVTTQKSCNQCNGTNLQYVQGCATCLDCGNSKCG